MCDATGDRLWALDRCAEWGGPALVRPWPARPRARGPGSEAASAAGPGGPGLFAALTKRVLSVDRCEPGEVPACAPPLLVPLPPGVFSRQYRLPAGMFYRRQLPVLRPCREAGISGLWDQVWASGLQISGIRIAADACRFWKGASRKSTLKQRPCERVGHCIFGLRARTC